MKPKPGFAVCQSCDPPRLVPAEGAVAHLTEHHLSADDIVSVSLKEREETEENDAP